MKKKTGQVAFSRRIITKILIVLFISVLAMQVVVTSFSTQFARNRLGDNQTANLTKLTHEKGVSLEQYVTDQKVIAQLVKTNPTIVQQAVTYAATGAIKDKQQESVAVSLKTIFENTGSIYENLFVTVGTKGYADCLGNVTLHDVGEENFYIRCMEDGYFFGTNVSPVTGRPVYVIAYAIEDSFTTERIGSVNMSIDMEALGKDIVNDADYTVYVINADGFVVATNGSPEMILTNYGEQNPELFAKMLENGNGCELTTMVEDPTREGYQAYDVSENFITIVCVDKAIIDVPANEMTRNLTIISVFMGTIALLVAVIVISRVVKPASRASQEIHEVIESINEGHGDLSKNLTLSSKDEIGVLVSGINDLMTTMGGIISSVQETASGIQTSSEQINEQIGRAEDEISNVSSTMEEMSAASQETSASINQVMVQVDTVAQLVEEVSKQSIEQATYADEVVNKVSEIREKSEQGRIATNDHLNEVAKALQNKIENAKQVQEIANLTDEIINITSQTNLLSLNASIEAARAGEAGKGFAVVADEIRHLADSSAEAASRIQTVTSSVIKAVEELAAEAGNVTEFMLKNNEKEQEQTNSLTDSYSEDIQQLSSLLDTFRESSEQIQVSITTIREAMDAVDIGADETAKGITNVAQATVDLSSQLETVAKETSRNVSDTNTLADEMNKFTV